MVRLSRQVLRVCVCVVCVCACVCVHSLGEQRGVLKDAPGPARGYGPTLPVVG